MHQHPSTTRSTHRGATVPLRLVALMAVTALLTLQSAVNHAQADPAPAEGRYVALGDSYASGFGVSPYDPGTGPDNGNDCQRSTLAYAHQIGDRTGKDLDFRACGGATTADFYRMNPSHKEGAQLDELNADTGLVTFSIGGNDAGFGEVVRDCIDGWELLSFNTCYSDERITDRVDTAMDALRGTGTRDGTYSYDTIFDDIRSRAPNATVIAVGYPHFFPAEGADGDILPGRCQGIKKIDQRWMVEKIDEINAILEDSAQRHGYQFTNPTASFDGHELCSSDSWFYGLLSPGRFHPTANGHTAMADDIMDTIADQGQAAAVNHVEKQSPVADPTGARPDGAVRATRSGDQLTLDASASADPDGTVAGIDWYVERQDDEEVLHGAQVTATVPADEPISVTAVITDDQGLTDFVGDVVPAADHDPNADDALVLKGGPQMPVSSIDTSTLAQDGTGSAVATTQQVDPDADGNQDLVVTLDAAADEEPLCITGRITDGSRMRACVPTG